MTPAALAPPALHRLLDDASQFPPGDLGLEDAVLAHAAWRRGPHAGLVGRLLTPAARVADLARGLPDDAAGWEVGIVVPRDLDPAAAAAAAEALAPAPVVVSAVELPLAAGAAAIESWRGAFGDADLYVEGLPGDLPAIAALGARAKLRCGGLAAAAIPDVRTVAAFLRGCAELDLPFKATAGLHQPLRHFAPGLGASEHGFLNLLVATAGAAAGADAAEVARVLGATSQASLGLDEVDLANARHLFTAFGTCSIAEPIEALRALELLGG